MQGAAGRAIWGIAVVFGFAAVGTVLEFETRILIDLFEESELHVDFCGV